MTKLKIGDTVEAVKDVKQAGIKAGDTGTVVKMSGEIHGDKCCIVRFSNKTHLNLIYRSIMYLNKFITRKKKLIGVFTRTNE